MFSTQCQPRLCLVRVDSPTLNMLLMPLVENKNVGPKSFEIPSIFINARKGVKNDALGRGGGGKRGTGNFGLAGLNLS